MSKNIPLTQGKTAIVDDADYENLSGVSWHVSGSKNALYASTTQWFPGKCIRLRMHNLLLPPTPGFVVDHKNGNSLDNRRCNLRACTQMQNVWNQHATPRGVSRFMGVYKDGGRWRARITCAKRRISIGQFRREVDAAVAYDEACRVLRGEFARPNFSLTVSEKKLRGWVSRTGGRFFTVCFIKRTDGLERVMHCRTGVSPLPGPSIINITETKKLLSVWDVSAREFRYVPLEGILWIRFKKTYMRPLRVRPSALDATTQGLLSARTAG